MIEQETLPFPMHLLSSSHFIDPPPEFMTKEPLLVLFFL